MRKPKKTRGRKTKHYWLTILLVCIPSLIVIPYFWKENQKKQERHVWSSIGNLVVVDAQKSHAIDRWWLLTEPPATLDTYELLRRKRNEVTETLNKYRTLSPQTEKIAKRFMEFGLSVFIRNEIRFLKENGVAPILGEKAVQICFLTEETARQRLIYSVSWRPDLNTVIIPGIEYPEKLRIALLFHELGHAFRHNKYDHGNRAVVSSKKDVILEEIEMHEFSADILNALTKGSYYRLIDEILLRRPREKRFERIAASITQKDKEAFDALCDCAGTELGSKMLATNYIMLIGFHHAERNGLGINGKISVFEKLWRMLELE